MVPVALVRDTSDCILQKNPSNHPDRFKCIIQQTSISSEPGTHGNEEVALRGKNGCLIAIRPVTWAWAGNSFIFESDEDLNTVNECFSPGTKIWKSLKMPKDVTLLRDSSPCIFQENPSNHPDRFKCMLQPTNISNEPGSYGNEEVGLRGSDECLLFIKPVTWAWEGNAFIFESDKDLDTINGCFSSGTLITENNDIVYEIEH